MKQCAFESIKICLLLFFLKVQSIGAIDQSKLIYDTLFKDYNSNLRPVKSASETITVLIDPVLTSLEGVNEPQEYINVAYWFNIDWKDDYLQWDPILFGNVKKIAVPSRVLWVPDVTLATVTRVIEIPKADDVFCQVRWTGRISCQFNQVLTTKCPMNVGMFPFDRQNCTLLYYSWSYGANELQLTTPQRQGNVKYLKNNTEWDFQSYTNVVILRKYFNSDFSEVRYFLVIKRKPMYYIYTLVLPSFLISTLALIGLFSPFSATGERQEKVSMGLTTLLTMAVLLLVISEQMPKTSQGLPMIGIYILFEIIMASFGTLATVLVMYLHKHVSSGKALPNWLLSLTCMQREWTPHLGIFSTVYRKRESCSAYKVLIQIRSQESLSRYAEPIIREQDPLRFQIEECLKSLIFMKRFLEEKQQEEERIKYWTNVCNRIDVFFLIVFNFINISFSLIWGVTGLSN